MILDVSLVPIVRHFPIKGDVVQVGYFDFDSDGYKDLAVLYREPLGEKLPAPYKTLLPPYRFYLVLYRGKRTWYGRRKLSFSKPLVRLVGDGSSAYFYAETRSSDRANKKNAVKFALGEAPFALWDDLDEDGTVEYVFKDGNVSFSSKSFPAPVERAWSAEFANSTERLKILALLSNTTLFVYKLFDYELEGKKVVKALYSYRDFLKDFPRKPWIRVEASDRVRDFAQFLLFGDFDGDTLPDIGIVSELSSGDGSSKVRGVHHGVKSGSVKNTAPPGVASSERTRKVLVFLQGGKNFTQAVSSYDVSGFYYFASADFNMDGRWDIVMFPYEGRVTFAKASGGFRFSLSATELVPGTIALADDFTYDGVPDLLIGYQDRIQIQKGEKVTGLVMSGPVIGRAGRHALPAMLFGFRSGYLKLGDRKFLWATAPLLGEAYIWRDVRFVRLPSFQALSRGFGLEAASGDIDGDGYDELVVLSENETFIYRGTKRGLQVGISLNSPVTIDELKGLSCSHRKIIYILKSGKLVLSSINVTAERWTVAETKLVDPGELGSLELIKNKGMRNSIMSFPFWGRYVGKLSFVVSPRGVSLKGGLPGYELLYEEKSSSVRGFPEENSTVGGRSENESFSPVNATQSVPEKEEDPHKVPEKE